MAECRSCGALIVWVATERGKIMPVDAKPDPKGNVIFLAGRRTRTRFGDTAVVRVLAAQPSLLDPEAASVDGLRYMSHFATCPQAHEHRH